MKGWMKLGAVALLSWRWLALLTIGVAVGMEALLVAAMLLVEAEPEMLARVLKDCETLDCLE